MSSADAKRSPRIQSLGMSNEINRAANAPAHQYPRPMPIALHMIDSVLDLLLDGVTGTVRFAEVDRWSHAQLFRALADVTGNDRAPGEGINDVISSPERGPTNSNLPPVETVLERFVADRRRLQERTLGSHCPQTREF